MFVTRVSINREGYFGAGYGKPDASKPFRCTMELHGQHGKVELNLSPEMSERIVSLVAEEVAAAGRATAEALTASIIDQTPQIAA